MYHRSHSVTVRIITILLVTVMMFPVGASAAVAETVQPRASAYLNSYNAYVYPAGGGKVQVWYSVTGTDYMDTIGALRITIYESTGNNVWTIKATFNNISNPDMLHYNDYFHGGYVECQGVAGRYYKAYVCVWAGENDDGDTRYFWTSAKQAT